MTASAPRAREQVGPYQLVQAIGAGGSARIDLARVDRAYGFQRHVVIKRPLEHLRADPKAAASLRREARLGGRLRHPNLVAILDAGVHDGYDYLVLEYVHGGALRGLVQTDAPARVADVPLEVALAIVHDVAHGLHVAHELADEHGAPLGLVHRDVSPGNVLVGLDGAVKLADFGIAKETRVATLSGSMHGTVTYMAPEQCRGHAFDRRADVFSLGVILYELVTGTRLFWADNDVASLHRVLAGTVPRPRKVRPQLAPALEDLVLTALAPDPERRFATARALADALEAHAAEAGAILGARRIARWVHDVIGPRDAPWIGAATIVDAGAALADAPAPAGSLVALIAATPDEPPPAVAFGPSDGAGFDDDAIETAARPPRRRVRAGMIAGVAAAGIAIGAVAIARALDDAPPTTTRPSAAVPPTAPSAPAPTTPFPPAAPAAPTPPTAAVTPETDAPIATPAPATPAPPPPTTTTTTTTAATPHERSAPPRAASDRRRRAPAIVAPSRAAAGSASVPPAEPPPPRAGGAATPPAKPTPANVEWDPTMLLPTDTGSGTKK